jgi:flagellar secretion chaperone FliS
MSDTMFTPVSTRAASAYKRVSVETSVDGASPHQLVNLLFDALLQSLAQARAALQRGDQPVKGAQLGKAVRLIEEGLKCALDDAGGEVAGNLRTVYSYAVRCLTEANLKNDLDKVTEVIELFEPIADAWKQIG